jgi:hypothetical protein
MFFLWMKAARGTWDSAMNWTGDLEVTFLEEKYEILSRAAERNSELFQGCCGQLTLLSFINLCWL